MRQLLAIPREADLPVVVQRIPHILNFSDSQIMQPNPLYIEEPAEPPKWICAACAATNEAPHARIALKAAALVHSEDEDDSGTCPVGIVQLLLVLPLCRPDIVLHGPHDIIADVTRDHKKTCPLIL